jgi:hypothetical protein
MRLTFGLTLASAGAMTIAGSHAARAQGDMRVITPRASVERFYQDDHRAALGITTSATGTARDTLGLMITSITRNGPAEHAGLEEGNRIAAINGVNLRANAADIEDTEMSSALTHRLTREMSKVKAGDEVELRVYRDGRTQTIRVRTADADTLFHRRELRNVSRSDWENRPALGFGIGSSGSRRDTLGVLVMSVADSTPAARAGLEEGNRVAAINGVNLRVPREDAGDPYLGSAKARRLQTEISQLKPGDDVTLRVYSNGQFRDVRLKVARAGDLPRRAGGTFFFGDGMNMMMSPMPPMPAMPPMPPMPMAPMRIRGFPMSELHVDFDGPEIEAGLREAATQIERVQPMLDHLFQELPRRLERIRVPDIRIDVDGSDAHDRQVRALERERPARRQLIAM